MQSTFSKKKKKKGGGVKRWTHITRKSEGGLLSQSSLKDQTVSSKFCLSLNLLALSSEFTSSSIGTLYGTENKTTSPSRLALVKVPMVPDEGTEVSEVSPVLCKFRKGTHGTAWLRAYIWAWARRQTWLTASPEFWGLGRGSFPQRKMCWSDREKLTFTKIFYIFHNKNQQFCMEKNYFVFWKNFLGLPEWGV